MQVQYFRDTARVPTPLKGAVLALGNFDGLHLGHQAVLAAAHTQAKRLGTPLLLATFEPHPRRLFKTEQEPFRLTPPIARLMRAPSFGVDGILALRFTPAFAACTAESFVKEILQEQLAVRAVVVGEGFRFGNRRLGSVDTLRGLGMETEVVPPRRDATGAIVSSSRIRSLLRDGKPQEAAQLLGRPYAMVGRVHRGAGRGAELKMATANLSCPRFLAPKYGVYAVRGTRQAIQGSQGAQGTRQTTQGSQGTRQTTQGSQGSQGTKQGSQALQGTGGTQGAQQDKPSSQTLDGVANFGIRPMYPSPDPLLESHFFATLPSLYGTRLSVSLIAYLRPEAKFDSAEQLAEQMQRDKQQAQDILAKF